MWLPSLAATDSSFQTSGTTVTAHATSHTKGSWAQLVASAPFDVTRIGVGSHSGTSGSSTNTSQLTDIGVGANPNEKVLIANIPTGYSTLHMSAGAGPAWFPVEIPSGTRISARMQAVITVDEVDIRLFMYGGTSWSSIPVFQSVDTLGAVTASSHGTQLSTSITELIASTAEDYKAIGWGVDGGSDTSLGSSPIVEIYVGAGAAEKVLIDDLQVYTSGTEAVHQVVSPQGILPMEMNIPAGSRISAKYDAGTANIGLVVYGFR